MAIKDVLKPKIVRSFMMNNTEAYLILWCFGNNINNSLTILKIGVVTKIIQTSKEDNISKTSAAIKVAAIFIKTKVSTMDLTKNLNITRTLQGNTNREALVNNSHVITKTMDNKVKWASQAIPKWLSNNNLCPGSKVMLILNRTCITVRDKDRDNREACNQETQTRSENILLNRNDLKNLPIN